MRYHFSAVIQFEDGFYVALCPELDVVSQGKTLDEARASLEEAVKLYLETADPSEIPSFKQPPYITTLDIAV